jgi:cytidine deaminase
MLQLLRIACKVANPMIDRCRKAYIGCVAVRKDGAIVSSRNGATPRPSGISPQCHAERRALKKTGVGAILYVARVRKDGSVGMAMPCARCRASMRAMGVTRVYYTVDENEWRCMIP